jgi:L-rhamnose isomerase
MKNEQIKQNYLQAQSRYAELGVDTEKVLQQLGKISLSLHCWQADDVGGFEHPNATLSSGGIQATGHYPGKARTINEMRQDMEKVFALIPGKHRYNLHAIYGDFGGKFIDRDAIGPEHFQSWISWAKNLGLKLDFNCTLFSHPKADDGFTLSHKNPNIRNFWIAHVDRCREISAAIGKTLGGPCIHNLWIPDGCKDSPIDRAGHRLLLKDSLDKIYSKKFNPNYMKDAVEGKLFGIGSESFVVGSHEFYLAYALQQKLILTLDMGHYHPTESVADKVSALLPYYSELLLHLSRGVRWDSDHVVIFNDELRDLCLEVVRAQKLDQIHFALDYFDASINRLGAYVIGARATLNALLYALLEPLSILREVEESGNDFQRLALLEELKLMPFSDVWNYYCYKNGVPIADDWIKELLQYEKTVFKNR